MYCIDIAENVSMKAPTAWASSYSSQLDWGAYQDERWWKNWLLPFPAHKGNGQMLVPAGGWWSVSQSTPRISPNPPPDCQFCPRLPWCGQFPSIPKTSKNHQKNHQKTIKNLFLAMSNGRTKPSKKHDHRKLSTSSRNRCRSKAALEIGLHVRHPFGLQTH